MKVVQKVFSALAVLALVACATTTGGNRVNVTLSGAEEVPPVSTAARGSGSFTIGADGAVSGSVTTTGVQGTMAHIHMAPRGQNGPVIVPLTKSGDTYTAPAGAKLTAEQLAAFRAGNLYINVHSDANKGGEVRGQLRP